MNMPKTLLAAAVTVAGIISYNNATAGANNHAARAHDPAPAQANSGHRPDRPYDSPLASSLTEKRGESGSSNIDNDIAAVDSNDKRSFSEKIKDASITADIKSSLLLNSDVSGLNIDVDTVGGKVTLSGEVDSTSEAKLAEHIAKTTDDVKHVSNKLRVQS